MNAVRCYLIAVLMGILWPLWRLGEWLHGLILRDLENEP